LAVVKIFFIVLNVTISKKCPNGEKDAGLAVYKTWDKMITTVEISCSETFDSEAVWAGAIFIQGIPVMTDQPIDETK
jgi:hypothetical protein